MIGLLAALALAAAPPPPTGPLSERIRASAATAEALQGPLDGTWTLYDTHRRGLYELQISDPAGGFGPLDAGWRGLGPRARAGGVTELSQTDGVLSLAVGDTHGGILFLSLRRRGANLWTGWATQGERRLRVSLRRRP
jgi:hypothetical protein